MYYVYFIQSKKYNETYIGSTNDLRRRLFEHNNSVEISTRRYKPWRLVYYEAYRSENDAREREMKLKKHGNAVKELKKRIQRSIENGAKSLPRTTFPKRNGAAGLPHTKKNGAGFTLMEAIVAIFVIIAGIVGVMTLITHTITSAQISKDKLIAAYLAQEGIEIVRNIRDTNWLQAYTAPSPWNDGLLSGNWEADLTTVTFSDTANFETCADPGYNCHAYADNFLKLDGGFYNYALGTDTKFKRKITISDGPISNNSLNVKVEVFWQEKGRTYQVTVQENLYNWK